MLPEDTPPVLQTLSELVAINSVNPNYDGGTSEARIAEYVEDFFQSRSIITWRQQVYPDRPNLIARIPGRDSRRRLVFEAHLDTVAAVGMDIAPWDPVIRDGRLYGRGACDTKGGLAAMMHALARLADEAPPPVDVLLAATIDEEFSYRGVVAFCHSPEPGPVDPDVLKSDVSPEATLTADAAIVAEPTMLQPVIASKGLVRFRIEALGRAAHSAKPHLGANAIEAMAGLILTLQEDTIALGKRRHSLLGSATCNVGVVRGGTQINFVPDRCEIEIDRRMLPGETREQVLAHYWQLAEAAARQSEGIRFTLSPPLLSDRPLETAPDAPAVRTMVQVLQELGHDPTLVGVPFCSDASKFGALGIPTMILGPGSIDQAHAAVEYVDCQQVVAATTIYHRFAREFPGAFA